MFYLVLLTVLFVPSSKAQDVQTNPVEDKSQCMKRMVDWCNGMQYSQNNTGMSMLSLSYGDWISNNNYRVLCVADTEGTNCSRNASPWFSCSPDHTLTYKGQVMTESSTDVDDDICNTTKKAFDELSLQTLTNSYNLNLNMKELQEEMAEMMNMFRNFQREMSLMFGGGYGDGGVMFPELNFGGHSGSEHTSTEDSNQIEKEYK